MTMAEVGRAGQRVDPLYGGDVAPDGRLLSVQEIQRRFREERARRVLVAPEDLPSLGAATKPIDATAAPYVTETTTAASRRPATASLSSSPTDYRTGVEPSHLVKTHAIPAANATQCPEGRRATTHVTAAEHHAADKLDLPVGWLRVLAGHSGAGSSTVALAIADSAAAAGRQAHLVEAAHPSRSGLVAASSAELGLDESGTWRRGTRGQPALVGQVTINRRANDVEPSSWPMCNAKPAGTTPADPGDGPSSLVVVDLGLVAVDALDGVAVPGCPVVIVCRPSIPGVRLTEQLLDRLGLVHAVLAVLGQRRWPGEVVSSSGPRLRALRDTGRIVTVPIDRRLETTGPTYAPLPKVILAAGRELLGAIEGSQAIGPGGDPA